VDTLIQAVHDLTVAGQALVLAEKVSQPFVYICRIRMEVLRGNVLVTVLAGVLHVGRNV